MVFDWDAANVGHIARHRVTPEECEEAYRNGPIVIERQRRRHERRRLCLGETNRGRLLTFVVTERRGKIRFVTAHPMHPTQREIYRGEKYDGQDQDSEL
jgi:uncharacterized DUF497 family protein